MRFVHFSSFFFFNDTATTEIYTLSLHDALPISKHFKGRVENGLRSVRTVRQGGCGRGRDFRHRACNRARFGGGDRKSTRLNSSHDQISYAVFCLKKKKNNEQ